MLIEFVFNSLIRTCYVLLFIERQYKRSESLVQGSILNSIIQFRLKLCSTYGLKPIVFNEYVRFFYYLSSELNFSLQLKLE